MHRPLGIKEMPGASTLLLEDLDFLIYSRMWAECLDEEHDLTRAKGDTQR